MDRKMTDLFTVVVKTNIWMFMLLLKVRAARATRFPLLQPIESLFSAWCCAETSSCSTTDFEA